MKKIFALLLGVCMVFSFTACDANEGTPQGGNQSSSDVGKNVGTDQSENNSSLESSENSSEENSQTEDDTDEEPSQDTDVDNESTDSAQSSMNWVGSWDNNDPAQGITIDIDEDLNIVISHIGYTFYLEGTITDDELIGVATKVYTDKDHNGELSDVFVDMTEFTASPTPEDNIISVDFDFINYMNQSGVPQRLHSERLHRVSSESLAPDSNTESPTNESAPVESTVSSEPESDPVDYQITGNSSYVFKRNEDATISITAAPNTEYYISVHYSSGESTAEGLHPKTTDSNGNVSWTWHIGGRTKHATYNAYVSGNGERFEISFEVVD